MQEEVGPQASVGEDVVLGDIDPGNGGGGENECNCTYEILAAGYTGQYAPPFLRVDLGTSQDLCSSFEQYFHGTYNESAVCTSGILPYFDIWPSLPPPAYTSYPFNCPLPPFSSFTVQSLFYGFEDDDCTTGVVWEPYMTFVIRCQDTGCEQRGYTSGKITFSYPNWVFDEAVIELQGACGCQPVVVE